jgi:flagellar hook-associated protein 3 FlgL
MTITPFAAGAYRSDNSTRILLNTRSSLDDLQRQLGTQKKSETYGGLGAQRFTSLDFRAKAAEVKGYQSTITQFQIRVKQLDLGLTELNKIGNDLRSSTLSSTFDPDASGKTSGQQFSRLQFDQAVDILNTEVAGVHIYSGRSSDVRPVVDAKSILEGDVAGRAGVKQMIAERRAADFGTAPNVGRIIQGGAGTTATLTEDGAHPFGFKLTAASSSSPTSITVGLTPATPAPPAVPTAAGSLNFNVATNPVDGDVVRFELTLPDGSKQSVQITARAVASNPPSTAGEFIIGATPADTALNLRTSIAAVLNNESVSNLSAASAKVAADAFFAGSTSTPPQRVPAPAATATSLVAGTAANTVIWYKGDDDQSLSARNTTNAKIDSGQVIGVGVRANEEGVRRMLSSLAIYSTETFTANPVDKSRHQALNDRIRSNLGQTNGVQSLQSIQVEIAAASFSMKGAEERHKTRLFYVESVISEVEDTNQDETAAKILSLQTRLQASYQTTSIISRLNLTEYLR